MQNYGMLLLAIYLVLVGIKAIFNVSLPYDHMVLGVVAVATGVLLFMKK